MVAPEAHPVTSPESARPSGARRIWKWVGVLAVVGAIALCLTLICNNYALRPASRQAMQARSDAALEKAIAWIAEHPTTYRTNPTIMYFVTQIEALTNDPRLLPVIEEYRRRIIPPRSPVEAVWGRVFDSQAPVPRVTSAEMRFLGLDTRWNLYGIAPDRVELTPEERAGLYTPDGNHWGTRQHQMLSLTFYRNFNGSTPELDRLISHLAEGVATDAFFDFRVSDNYIQRTTYVLAAGQPQLIRARWVERILDYQNPDGSWNYCWYGWCRGVLEFGFKYNPGHPTVQAAWALAMLKYRYPQWYTEHYQ